MALAPDARPDTPDASFHLGEDGFIGAWLTLGPIPRMFQKTAHRAVNGKDAMGVGHVQIPPHADQKSLGLTWRARLANASSVSLKGPPWAVYYLAAVVRADRPGHHLLATGSSGELDVWLNGRHLFSRRTKRRAHPDTDLADLDLQAGDNLLILKLRNGQRPNGQAFVRLMTVNFKPADGIAIVLPGLDGTAQKEIVEKTARLVLDRRVNLRNAHVDVGIFLDFPGGAPVFLTKPAFRMHLQVDDRPSPIDETSPARRPCESRLYLGNLVIDQDRVSSAITVSAGDARFQAPIGCRMEDVLRLSEARRMLDTAKSNVTIDRTTLESLEWRVSHLTRLIEQGDDDLLYLNREIGNTLRMTRLLAGGTDPYFGKRDQVQRRGYRSSIDGRLHEYVLYVPPGWRETGDARFGLVISLHGLGSKPMKAIQSVFGLPLEDGETKHQRNRHPKPVSSVPYFVLAPEGFGASAYREYGEVDILDVLREVQGRYRIDPARIYVTGASMGGIGAASLPFHYPDRFAAAAPLCGYHNYFLYRGLKGVSFLPWERFLLEHRSNVYWADNGRYLPLYAVHGMKDSPGHSRVLVDRYRKLGYSVKLDTPDLAHNVWDETYRDRRIFQYFAQFRRKAHPREITFRTARLRYRTVHWMTIDDVTAFHRWSQVDANWHRNNHIEIRTDNIEAFSLVNDPNIRGENAMRITVDGIEVGPVDAEAPRWQITKDQQGQWTVGPVAPCEHLCKKPGLAGPIRDVQYEPLLLVYGTGTPAEEVLTRRLANQMRFPRPGTTVRWRVIADTRVTSQDIENHSLVIVGTTEGNALLRRIASQLPIAVRGNAIQVGDRPYPGTNNAAAMIYPNPLNPDRYVVVHTAVSLRGLFYAAHLPEILPDYIVYDGSTWEQKMGRVLDGRPVLCAGFFDKRWQVKNRNEPRDR